MAITGSTDLGNGYLTVTVDHDPRTTPTNVPTGTRIISTAGPAVEYIKQDDGSTTNVTSTAPSYNVARFATTTNDTLSGLAARDGVTPVAGDIALVKNQTTPSENGLYIVASGAWSRAASWVTGSVWPQMQVGVSEGTTLANTSWKITTQGAITVGTTSVTFTQFTSGTADAPAGATGEVQFNSAGVFGAATNLTINAGGFPVAGEASSTTPAAPAAGSLLFSRFRAGRRMAAQIGPTGRWDEFQPASFGAKIGTWNALGNTTTVNSLGIAENATGTATARTVATTNLSTSMRRLGYVMSNASGSSAGTRHNLAQWWMGNAAGLGGFFYSARFFFPVATNGQVRWFVGLSATTATLANANPSTLLNLVGFSIDSTQTTIRFINNDGAGAATATDLGANFPATTTTAVYEARIFVAPNTTTVYYSLERLDSAQFTEGSVNTNIPANTTLLSPQIWVNNGSSNGTLAVDVVSQYIETDF